MHVVFGITFIQSLFSVSASPASRGGSAALEAVLVQCHHIAESPGARAGLQPGPWVSSSSTLKRKGVGNREQRVELLNRVDEGRCTWVGVTRRWGINLQEEDREHSALRRGSRAACTSGRPACCRLSPPTPLQGPGAEGSSK